MEDIVWGEYFCYSTQFNALPVGTGVSYLSNEIRIDSDADFQFLGTSYYSTNDNADIFVKYKDDTVGRYLMKYGALLRSVAGRSLPVDNNAFDFRTFKWPVPYTIRRATTFTVEAANSNAFIAPTVYITFHGRKMRTGIAPWKKPGLSRLQYTYPLQKNVAANPDGMVTVGPNQTVSISVSTDRDSHFVCSGITGDSTGEALVTIQEGGRDRQWMNTGVHIRNLVGSGAFPNILSSPRFISKGSVVNITIQDLSGANNNVVLNLVGSKIFGVGNGQ